MATKTTGAQFKAFYSDPAIWDEGGKDGWFVDDMLISVDGNDDMDAINSKYGDDLANIPDNAEVKILSGYLDWQGRGPAPNGTGEQDLEERFKAWSAAQSTVTFVATIQCGKHDEEHIARVQRALQELGAEFTRSDVEPAKPSSPKP